ncbi:MAG: hypothetical protein KTR17_06865 [Cellvibrionaceae bacterium]|nr:hypothetical protein [Cellvibrionaceae bacterium]
MTCWEILKIEPTPIVLHIKKAYAVQLKITNPETKPQAFMRLNAAYKEAVASAKHLSVGVVKTTETRSDNNRRSKATGPYAAGSNHIDSLRHCKIESVEALQHHLVKLSLNPSFRWHRAAWQSLLDQALLMNIKTMQAAQDACLTTVVSHGVVPGFALKMLLTEFGFYNNKLEMLQRLGRTKFIKLQALLRQAETRMEEDSLRLHPERHSPSDFQRYLKLRYNFAEDLIYQTDSVDILQQKYRELLAIYPQDFELRVTFAIYLYFNGGKDQSGALLETLLADDIQAPRNHCYIELLLTAAEYYCSSRQLHKLPSIIQRTSKEHLPDEQQCRLAKYSARYYATKYEYDAAIILLEQVLAATPHDYQARLLRTEYRREYYIALQSQRQAPDVQAELVYKLSQYKTVIAIFEDYADFFATSDCIFCALAFHKLDRYEEMNTEVGRVFSFMQKNNIRAYENVKKLCVAEAVFDIDKKTFEKYITRGLGEFSNPNIMDIETHLAACILFKNTSTRTQQDIETEIFYLDSALYFGRIAYKINQDHNLLNFHFSHACYLKKQYREAIAPLESYLLNNYSSFIALFRLGYCYLECEKYEQAIDRFEKALRIARDAAWRKSIFKNLRYIYTQLKNSEKVDEYSNEIENLERAYSNG